MESTPALEISIIIYLIGNVEIPIIIALRLGAMHVLVSVRKLTCVYLCGKISKRERVDI